MNRRIRIILLTVSLLLVVGTLGWLTHVLLIQAEETGRSERRIKVESLAHEAKLEMDRLLTAFITFEQARGYYEYLPFYAYKRPYDQRMDAPAPGEPARSSNLASYLPDYVTAYLQISPSGQVTGPALNKELSERLNREKNLYQRLNEKVSALISLPASGNLWADIRNEILHEVPEPEPPQDGVPAQVETVSSFVPVEDGGNLDLGLQHLEAALDVGQRLVAPHHLVGGHVLHVGHQHELAVHQLRPGQRDLVDLVGEQLGLQVDPDDARQMGIAHLMEEARLRA